MKRFWTEGAYEDYLRAAEVMQYPEVPFGPFLETVVRPRDRVADLGAGFGVVSRDLAGRAREVVAIDQDSHALAHLARDARTQGLTNIRLQVAIWPEIKAEPWDVAIIFYHAGAVGSPAKRQRLFALTRREGLINTAIGQRESFHRGLAQDLGLDASEPSFSAAKIDLEGLLQETGFNTQTYELTHDFSQPVDDLDDAVRYMMAQLRLDPALRDQVRALAPKYLQEKDGCLRLPILRKNKVIRFWKPDASIQALQKGAL